MLGIHTRSRVPPPSPPNSCHIVSICQDLAMVPGLASLGMGVSMFGGRKRLAWLLLIMPGACHCWLNPLSPPRAQPNRFSSSGSKGVMRPSGTAGKKSIKPGLWPALTCPVSGLEPLPGEQDPPPRRSADAAR